MPIPLKSLLLATASGIAAYWAAVFAGVLPIADLAPGYRNWFLSYPLADGWIALAAILAVTSSPSNKALSAIFTAAAGSGLIFLGLSAFTYGFVTGLIHQFTLDESMEIAIKVYCLGAGSIFVAAGYRQVLGAGALPTGVQPRA